MARAILIVKAVGVGLGRTRGVVSQKNGSDTKKSFCFGAFCPGGLVTCLLFLEGFIVLV